MPRSTPYRRGIVSVESPSIAARWFQTFQATAAIETRLEIDILAAGGILPLMLADVLTAKAGDA